MAISDALFDDWYNAITGIGFNTKDKRQGGQFIAAAVTDIEATELWRGDDLAARIVETVPNEMLRQGWELRIADQEDRTARLPGEPAEPGSIDETFSEATVRGDASGWLARRRVRRDAEDAAKALQEKVTSALEDLQLMHKLYEALCYERAYGGAAILLGVKDGQADLTKPLKFDSVRSLDYLTVLEPRECQPIAWYNDPTKDKFGDPAIYQIIPIVPGGTMNTMYQVHESRLIVFQGIKVTRRQQPGVMFRWGDSVLTRVYRVLRDFNLSWSSTAVLLNDFSQSVIKVKDLAAVMTQANGKALRDRMEAIELSRSVAHAVLIDSEEDYQRQTTSVTGLDGLLDRFSTRLAAAADQPLTLLMGQSPGGLNATGASDVRFFYDRIKSTQARKLRPPLERLIKLQFKCLGAVEPVSWSVHFCPLWQASELEGAQARFAQAQTDEKYVSMGALSPQEVAKSRFGAEEFSFDTQVDWEARANEEPTAPEPVQGPNAADKEQHDQAMRALDLKERLSVGDQNAKDPAGLRTKQSAVKKDDVRLDFIEKRGSKWVVLSHDGKVLGEHGSHEDAVKQLGAIEAAKARREE